MYITRTVENEDTILKGTFHNELFSENDKIMSICMLLQEYWKIYLPVV